MYILNTIHMQQQYRPKPLVLLILDGLGIAPPNDGNAVTLADTPNFDSLWKKYPHCFLQASGNSVGLPTGVNGNSEVGHMGLGAGKVVFQEIARIDNEIKLGNFFKNPIYRQATDFVKKNKGKLHLLGLVSDGKVHSSIEHLYACLEYARKEKLSDNQVFIHAFTDGRDTSPDSANKYLDALEKMCRKIGIGEIASIIGRYFAMDRDERWERTKMAYDLIVSGKGKSVVSWKEAIEHSYSEEITDEFIKPYVITTGGKPLATVSSGDAVVFFNYRADRAVQLSRALEDEPFSGWMRPKIKNLYFAGFSNYQKGMVMNRAKEDIDEHGGESQMVQNLFAEELQKSKVGFPKNQIFPPEHVPYSLGHLISEARLLQLRITESEKFPHVTYFFNCREKGAFNGEEREEIPSPKDVATYDQKPEMSSVSLTEQLLKRIEDNKFDFILVNFACPDMVAHTGNLAASVKAVQAVDECVGEVVKQILSKGGACIISADHGNAEELINLQTGEIDTEHSTNPVPFMFIEKNQQVRELPYGIIADIAPTILSVLGIEHPPGMTGRNLLS
jgi:2,3-bisphosphoglycerate-independent phosphoglycerate mutase